MLLEKDINYYILVGPRGCGKIEQACRGVDGIARIRVDKSNINVYELVAEEFGVYSPFYNFKNQNDLVKLFQKVSSKKGGNWVPTIVAEVDKGAEPGTVENFSRALKVKLKFSKNPDNAVDFKSIHE